MISAENWFVLYTKSRHEKLINWDLNRRQIEAFLPLRRIKRRWSDRSVVIEEPLFKSYLFVKTQLARKTEVLRTKGAVQFVRFNSQPVTVQESVIFSLKRLVDEAIAIDPFPYFNTGDRIFIKSGPFKGTEGFIQRKDARKCRLIVSVDAIQSSVSVEIDSCLVEKI